MEPFTQFITQNMYIVTAALYIIGIFCKAVPRIPDWTIPFVLAGLGILFGIWIIGAPQGILQGILSAGAAVLVNQMVKQAKKGKNGE